jgi:hypothetical protein
LAAATQLAPSGPVAATARQAPVTVPRRKAKFLRMVERPLFFYEDAGDSHESAPLSRYRQLTTDFWSDQGTTTRTNTAFRSPYWPRIDLIHPKQEHFLN